MRKYGVWTISFLPFYIMASDVLSNFIDLSDDAVYWVYATYNGHAVVTNLFMLITVFTYRYCLQVKLAVISLSLITFISLYYPVDYWAYVAWYDTIIYGSTLLVAVIMTLKKCLHT